MKKRFLAIIAFAVSLGILNPFSCFALEHPEDEYGTIVTYLESDSYGGAYIKEGVLHIKPLSEQSKLRLMRISGNANVVYDDIAQYSMEELNKAMEESVDLFDELDIDFVGIDEENNGLRVGMINVTEEKKERFCHEIAIDNILFEEVSVIESPAGDSSYAEADTGTERAADNEIQAGLDLFDASKHRLECTNAASVYDSKNQFYFVTTAHGLDVGDSMVYSRGEVGKVFQSVLSPSGGIDVALIKKGSDVKASMKVSSGGDGLILASGAPITGDEAKIFKTNKPVSVKIVMASCTKKWDSTTHNDKGTYKNIMMMEPTGSRTTEGGFSGAPVLVEFKNAGTTHYRICGVYKGGSEDAGTTTRDVSREYLYATRWDVLEDFFGVDLY